MADFRLYLKTINHFYDGVFMKFKILAAGFLLVCLMVLSGCSCVSCADNETCPMPETMASAEVSNTTVE